MNSYIYLIQDGEYKGTDIYKIGKTTQKGGDTRSLTRLKQYNFGTEQIQVLKVSNIFVDIIEKRIIEEFNNNFELVKGKEWFKGDLNLMIEIINKIIENFRKMYEKIKDKKIFEEELSHKVENKDLIENKDLSENKNLDKNKDLNKNKQLFLCEFCNKKFSKNMV